MLTISDVHDAVWVATVPCTTLDASNSGDFKQELKALVASQRRVVLDLTRVDFIDSSGVGAILAARRHAQASGGDLKLACLSKGVRVVVELTRMNRVLDIFETVEGAVGSYQD